MSDKEAAARADDRLSVLSFNVWYVDPRLDVGSSGAHLPMFWCRGLAFVSKDRAIRIQAIANYLAASSYDVVCLQELWIYRDYELVRDAVQSVLPNSRFFHT